MDIIDPQAKILPTGMEQTMITRKTDDREPQGERPGFRRPTKTGAPKTMGPDEEKPEDRSGIDIIV
jgi:hypothetical protein